MVKSGFSWLATMGLVLLLASAVAAPGDAAEKTTVRLLNRGKALVSKNCGGCHAIGVSGASSFDQAPSFRDVVKRYPPESLEEALAEGLATGHPAMPEFVFEPPQIAAILHYLNSLRR
jgi:cytochrome c